jgi:hypothetical protein
MLMTNVSVKLGAGSKPRLQSGARKTQVALGSSGEPTHRTRELRGSARGLPTLTSGLPRSVGAAGVAAGVKG